MSSIGTQYDQFGLPIYSRVAPHMPQDGQPHDKFDLPVGTCAIPTEEEAKLDQLIAEMDADPLHGAIRIAVTPAQIAAAFEYETLDNDVPRMTTRLFGAVRMLGSFVEGGLALSLAVTPEPTMLTKIAAGGIGLYAADQYQTGFYEMWNGRYEGSYLSYGMASGARALGASKTMADGIGMASEMIVPIGAAAYLNALRLAAVKAGRFSLAIHEGVPGTAGGGHTLLKHVGKSADYLSDRWRDALRVLANNSNKPPAYAYSSFRSVAEAEKYISQGLRMAREDIQAWAKTAPANAKKGFNVDFGSEIVGWGVLGRDVSTATTTIMGRFTKIRIVIKKTPYNGKLMFILTCYPVL